MSFPQRLQQRFRQLLSGLSQANNLGPRRSGEALVILLLLLLLLVVVLVVVVVVSTGGGGAGGGETQKSGVSALQTQRSQG